MSNTARAREGGGVLFDIDPEHEDVREDRARHHDHRE
jgi:hypothetical protein